MEQRFDRAIDVTRRSVGLAVVPVVATLLSASKVARTLAAGPGGGVAFPLPMGLPTLWTYVSLPAGILPSSGTAGGSLPAFLLLFVVGLLVTAALEAGFLNAVSRRIDGESGGFRDGVTQFTSRMVAVNLLRAAVVFVAVPVLVVAPPLAIVVVIALAYLTYGVPFEIVVTDASFFAALESTVDHALTGGDYALFGGAHLLGGALASILLSGIVRGALAGLLVGTAAVAVPAVFVAAYGLLVFRGLNAEGASPQSDPRVTGA